MNYDVNCQIFFYILPVLRNKLTFYVEITLNLILTKCFLPLRKHISNSGGADAKYVGYGYGRILKRRIRVGSDRKFKTSESDGIKSQILKSDIGYLKKGRNSTNNAT